VPPPPLTSRDSLGRVTDTDEPLNLRRVRSGAARGREPLDEWCCYSDGNELLNFCPECAEREFGLGSQV
jgi:hypothetical protein